MLNYNAVHLQPFYQRRGFSWACCSKAEQYVQGTPSIPPFPGLGQRSQDRPIGALSEVLGN
jgi:dTDP-4-amino-4,6-dideoxygalactose transaminase